MLFRWRIQDFPDRGRQPLNFWQKKIAENCMKMKEIGPVGTRPWRPLNLPMYFLRQGGFVHFAF